MDVANLFLAKDMISFKPFLGNHSCLLSHLLMYFCYLGSLRENLSSGFPTKRDSNQSPQL